MDAFKARFDKYCDSCLFSIDPETFLQRRLVNSQKVILLALTQRLKKKVKVWKLLNATRAALPVEYSQHCPSLWESHSVLPPISHVTWHVTSASPFAFSVGAIISGHKIVRRTFVTLSRAAAPAGRCDLLPGLPASHG